MKLNSICSITVSISFRVRLQTPDMNPMPKINITVFERLDEGVLGREVSSSGPYTSVPQGVATDAMTLLPNQYGYLIVVSTLEPGISGKFVLYGYSDRVLEIEAGGGASTCINVSGSFHQRHGSSSSHSSNSSPSVHGSLNASSSGYTPTDVHGGVDSSMRSLSLSAASSLPPPASSPTFSARPSARFPRNLGSGSGSGPGSLYPGC